MKAKHILLGVSIFISTLTQDSFANTHPQDIQSRDKVFNDPHTNGCPARLLGNFHDNAKRGVPDEDTKTGCSRKQPSYNILDNLTASQIPSASFEQRGCQILIFVSFSMPEASLKSLTQEVEGDQGNPCRPVLVMRGLYQDSFAQTAEKLKDLSVPVEINPELFEAHQVTVVPTFILVKDSKPLHCLKGNVTLAFVKERFALESQVPGPMHTSVEPGK